MLVSPFQDTAWHVAGLRLQHGQGSRRVWPGALCRQRAGKSRHLVSALGLRLHVNGTAQHRPAAHACMCTAFDAACPASEHTVKLLSPPAACSVNSLSLMSGAPNSLNHGAVKGLSLASMQDQQCRLQCLQVRHAVRGVRCRSGADCGDQCAGHNPGVQRGELLSFTLSMCDAVAP